MIKEFSIIINNFLFMGIGPNPQSPIPNPQSPIPKFIYLFTFILNDKTIKLIIKFIKKFIKYIKLKNSFSLNNSLKNNFSPIFHKFIEHGINSHNIIISFFNPHTIKSSKKFII